MQSPSFIASLNPCPLVARLWRHRDLVMQLTMREIRSRYLGTYLGFLWSILIPLLMLGIYTIVFSEVFQVKWRGAAASPETIDIFALTLFAGLVPFSVFSEITGRAPFLILRSVSYVKKTVFPLEVLPLVSVIVAVVHSFISVGVIIVGAAAFSGIISRTLFLLPFAYIPLVLLCLGLAWFLSSLGVYIRDVGQTMELVVRMCFFLSPVFYPISVVPEPLRSVLAANPLTLVLTSFRQVLLWQESLSWSVWFLWTIGMGVFAWLGSLWFEHTKRGFADVL